MSAYNTLTTQVICPSCKKKVQVQLQYKYGDSWQINYEVGQTIKWGGNDYGSPALKVIVDAISEDCPLCGFDDIGDFEILLKKDVIVEAKPSSGKYDFGYKTYVVIED